ncbi:hypothetical protein Q604_UNBC17348G0001, partial [human gut metagenome]
MHEEERQEIFNLIFVKKIIEKSKTNTDCQFFYHL